MIEAADDAVAAKEAQLQATLAEGNQSDPDVMRKIEKSILLQSIDSLWRDHLVTLDHLSKVVGWRGLAQRDPLNEYKQEAFELFQQMLTQMRELVTKPAEPRRAPGPPAAAAGSPTSRASAKSTSIRRPARTTPTAT